VACEYALANEIEHPKTVNVREDSIVPRLDAWIAELFSDFNLDATCAAVAMAQGADDEAEARAEAARRKIADCDRRLAKYRETLDKGGDAAVIAGWMAEVQGERLRAEPELGKAVPGDELTKEQIRKLVLSIKDIASVLRKADPKLKAEVYAELGVRVTYDPHRRVISVGAGPCTTARVGGGT
jgi:site-specific DNA recombinase